MDIDLNRIKNTYGENVVEMIENNIDDVSKNIIYLKRKGFNNIEDIFDSFTLLFIDSPTSFKEKIDDLIKEVGDNYVEVLEEDMDLWVDLF